MLFRAGGLYYIRGESHPDLFVFHTDIGLPDILEALRNHREADILVSTPPLHFNWCADAVGDAFTLLSNLEIEDRGKDRRREQIERGGHPPVSLLKMTKTSSWILVNTDDLKNEDATDSVDTDASDATSSDSDCGTEGDGNGDGDDQSQGGNEGVDSKDDEGSDKHIDGDDRLNDELVSADSGKSRAACGDEDVKEPGGQANENISEPILTPGDRLVPHVD